ncbi:unnamed protein product [Spirodela intermedia]|uniref:Uncharacterized protein n=2 Tax=Spirodela intermedia TaxID=51605 RepID=A0A7I8JX74_SPIIN|nr:unnamed protein product [Spirodela intermedia]CAA6654016.1 unnamed protein product [Spirodela intermedia]CAA7388475.1 unnamed protein product [Spirodela intermedia]
MPDTGISREYQHLQHHCEGPLSRALSLTARLLTASATKSLFEEMTTSRTKPKVITYNALIKGYCKGGNTY